MWLERLTPGLADGAETDVIRAAVEAAQDIVEEIRREIGPA